MTRAILLVLWICLLPARGWAADLMALESLGSKAAVASVAAAQDCHEAADHDDSVHADSECSECNACDICHACVMAPLFASAGLMPRGATPPQTHPALHASAELSPGIRPPIV